jgi:hypothetical protein
VLFFKKTDTMRASKGELATGRGSEVAATEGARCGVGETLGVGWSAALPPHPAATAKATSVAIATTEVTILDPAINPRLLVDEASDGQAFTKSIHGSPGRIAGHEVEPAGGIEPSTCCLQDSCSAN